MWKSSVSGELRYFAGTSADERPAAEGDDAAAEIGDREDDAIAEAIEGDRHILAETSSPAAIICSWGMFLPARYSLSAERSGGA